MTCQRSHISSLPEQYNSDSWLPLLTLTTATLPINPPSTALLFWNHLLYANLLRSWKEHEYNDIRSRTHTQCQIWKGVSVSFSEKWGNVRHVSWYHFFFFIKKCCIAFKMMLHFLIVPHDCECEKMGNRKWFPLIVEAELLPKKRF